MKIQSLDFLLLAFIFSITDLENHNRSYLPIEPCNINLFTQLKSEYAFIQNPIVIRCLFELLKNNINRALICFYKKRSRVKMCIVQIENPSMLYLHFLLIIATKGFFDKSQRSGFCFDGYIFFKEIQVFLFKNNRFICCLFRKL